MTVVSTPITNKPSGRCDASTSDVFFHEPALPPLHSNTGHARTLPHQQRTIPGRVVTVWNDDSAGTFHWTPSEPKIPRPGPVIIRVCSKAKAMVVDVTHGSAVFNDSGQAARYIGHWGLSAIGPPIDQSHSPSDGGVHRSAHNTGSSDLE